MAARLALRFASVALVAALVTGCVARDGFERLIVNTNTGAPPGDPAGGDGPVSNPGSPTAGVDGPFFVIAGTTLSLAASTLLANDLAADTSSPAALSIASVAGASHGTTELVDGRIVYTPDDGFNGADTFAYVVTDANGGVATGDIRVRVLTLTTWTGAAGDGLWSSPGNWCGGIEEDQRGCVQGTPPTATDIAIFDGTCDAPCPVTLDTPINVAGLRLSADFGGAIEQGSSAITLGATGYVQAAGSFKGSSDATPELSTATFELSGGQFVAPAGALTVSGNFTVTGAPTFDANGGLLRLVGSGTLTPGSIVLAQLYLGTGGCQFHTVVGTFSVAGDVTAEAQGGSCGASWLTGGMIDIKGNLTMLSGWALWDPVDTMFQLSGVDHVVSSTVPAQTPNIPSLRIAASGTVTLVGDVQIAHNLTWVSGTLDAGTSTVQFNGSGTIDLGAQALNNVVFHENALTSGRTVVGTLHVGGTLVLDPADSLEETEISGGTIDVNGSVGSYNAYASPSAPAMVLQMSGSGSLYQSSGQPIVCSGLVINSVGGTVTLASNIDLSLPGQTVTVEAGGLNMQGNNLTISSGLTLNGTVLTKGGGVLTVGGATVGTGQLFGGTIDP